MNRFRILFKKIVPLLGFFSSSLAFALQHFDDAKYKVDGNIFSGGAMNTLAGMTSWARDINHVYLITTVICVLVFFAVSIPLVYTIIKFRVREEDVGKLPPPKQVHGNAVLEFTWTIIPVILLLFIAIPTWQSIFSQPTKAPDGALQIRVIGHQWWWEFEYPSLGITTANELHLPENTPVFFTITSTDVIHSFWVPQWGGKVDALPGVSNSMYLVTPTKKDTQTGADHYQGQCVELCGLSHALMRFEGVIHTQDEFATWAKVYNEPPKLETSLQKKGAEVFNKCMSCHTISGTASDDMEKQMKAANPLASKVGPNLTNFGSRLMLGAGTRRNTHDNFVEWVKHPTILKPGALMQELGLTDEELEAVASYVRLSTIKDLTPVSIQ